MLRYSRLTSTPSHLFFAFLLQLLPADHLHQNTFHAAMLVTKQAPVVNGPELPIMPWIFWLKQKLYPKHPNMFTSMEKKSPLQKKISPTSTPKRKIMHPNCTKLKCPEFVRKPRCQATRIRGISLGCTWPLKRPLISSITSRFWWLKESLTWVPTFQFWIEAIRF